MKTSKINFITSFGLVFLPTILLTGCYKAYTKMNHEISPVQTVLEEDSKISILEKLAKQGDVEAQYTLGLTYETGKEVNQDYRRAFKWYEKAAERGLPSAQAKLGSMYRYGRGVEVDHTKATEWYFKAAEQGNEEASYELGTIYLQK